MASLTVTPDPLQSGGDAEVCIQDGTPDSTATVDIDDGALPVPETDSIQIQLDGNGDGCAEWKVAGWASANFVSTGCEAVGREIVS